MTAAQLRVKWANFPQDRHPPVIGFYSDRPNAGQNRVFSNFYIDAPFSFTIPDECGRAELLAAGRPAVVQLTFAEKGIMLCKAATMCDYNKYDAILTAQYPSLCKSLGRQVGPWDQARWDAVVCSVGVSVVFAKFSQTPVLKEILLATGDAILAETTRNDNIWGIGMNVNHPDVISPRKWKGANVLGWSLMQARKELTAEKRSVVDGVDPNVSS